MAAGGEQGGVVEYRLRPCPKCAAPSVNLPLMTSRRRNPLTCTNCGVQLERVYPGVTYYSLAFITAILGEAAALCFVFLAFFQQWLWMALIVLVIVLTNMGVTAFLNRRSRLEFANLEDARQDKPGRWYPQ